MYLDSAASSQRPRQVLDAMREYDETTHANVHRGVYRIAEEATRRFEAARVRWAGSSDPRTRRAEVVFAKTQPRRSTWLPTPGHGNTYKSGDSILLTEMEHHANVVPWLMLAEERPYAAVVAHRRAGEAGPRRSRDAGRRGAAGRGDLHVECAGDR